MKYILTISLRAIQFGMAQPWNLNEKDATLATGTDSTPFLRASSKSMPKVNYLGAFVRRNGYMKACKPTRHLKEKHFDSRQASEHLNLDYRVKGTVYIEEEWEQASVTTLTEKKIIKLLARFNAYSKEIEILKEKDFVALKPVTGISVTLNGKNFDPFKTRSSGKTIFAESLIEGELSLFWVFDVKVVKAASDATLLKVENEDRVTIIDKLYLRDATGKNMMLSRKRKEVFSFLDRAAQTFVKDEKTIFKKGGGTGSRNQVL